VRRRRAAREGWPAVSISPRFATLDHPVAARMQLMSARPVPSVTLVLVSAWHRMREGEFARQRAAMVELRAVLAGVRCAARLLERDLPSGPARSIVRTVVRAAARGERALRRLEQSASKGRPRSNPSA
jgi:hypothetical protein